MHRVVLNFLKDESGATAIEYSLMIALVAVVVISALDVAGDALAGVFQTVSLELDQAAGGAGAAGSGGEGTGTGGSQAGGSGAGGTGDDLSDNSGAQGDDSDDDG